MSLALQVAVFFASLGVIVLAACLVPMAFLMRSHLDTLVRTAEQSKTDMQTLVRDSHELIRTVTELSQRASRQLDEVDLVIAAMREWTERANHFVNEVGSVVEPPVFTIVRNLNLLRTGVAGFLHALLSSSHGNQSNKLHNETNYKGELHHV
jgi:uncharacterized protein YoxC